MRKTVLAVLLSLIVLNFPWRLGVLAVETLCLRPGLTHVVQGTNRYWDVRDLEGRLNGLGWSVGFTRVEEDIYGKTVPMFHVIVIDEQLSWNARLGILAHEAGHTHQPAWLNDEQGEVFAEAVALLYAHDGIREHARYLSKFKGTTLMLLLTEWPAIYHAAATLEDR
jgi:hypothetical protein